MTNMYRNSRALRLSLAGIRALRNGKSLGHNAEKWLYQKKKSWKVLPSTVSLAALKWNHALGHRSYRNNTQLHLNIAML